MMFLRSKKATANAQHKDVIQRLSLYQNWYEHEEWLEAHVQRHSSAASATGLHHVHEGEEGEGEEEEEEGWGGRRRKRSGEEEGGRSLFE